MPIVDGHIRCNACGEARPLALFQPSVVKAGCGACRECKYQQKRAYEKANRSKANAARVRHRRENAEQERAARRDRYRRDPERHRGYNLARYSITTADYDRLLTAQGGVCGCCSAGNPDGRRLFVDHDHGTGAVRGLLCGKCNWGIGALGDDLVGVRRALTYLERGPVRVGAPSVRVNLLRGASHVAA